MPVDLSDGTRARLAMLFAEADRAAAATLLIEECGSNLPSFEKASAADLERVRFAVLKLSEGDNARLLDAIGLAQTDWRDLLVAADFANDIHVHSKWWPKTRAG